MEKRSRKRSTARRPSRRPRSSTRLRRPHRRRPVRARSDRTAACRAPGRAGQGGHRRGRARPVRKASRGSGGRLFGLERTGPPTSWTVWLGDPGRHGPPRRSGRPPLPPAQLSSAADGLDVERVRAVRSVTTCHCKSTSTSTGASRRRSRTSRSSHGRTSTTSSSPCAPAIRVARSLAYSRRFRSTSTRTSTFWQTSRKSQQVRTA